MSSTGSLKTFSVYTAAILLAGVPAPAYVLQSGADAENLRLILRLTARFAVLIYLLIFVTRPLHQLRPSGITRTLLRNRRYIGVALAGVMTAHLVFIGWYWIFVLGKPLPPLLLFAGGGAYVLLFLMLITSFDKPARALGQKNWRRLHKTGLYWMGVVFASTIVPDLIANPTDPLYLIISVLMLAAIALRVTAFFSHQSTATITHRAHRGRTS